VLSLSILRIEEIVSIFEEFPFLKISIVDSSLLRIWDLASVEGELVLVESKVPEDEKEYEKELGCLIKVEELECWSPVRI
jgi:hypothetical protein